jgi:hypothetical protein
MKLVLILAAVLGLSLFSVEAKRPAHAGNPNHSISIVEPAPAFGDTVHVSFSTTEDEPWAHLLCYANETSQGVGGTIQEGYDYLGDGSAEFTLGPTPSWSGGGADCVVELGRDPGSRFHVLASYSFAVSP